MTNNEPMVATKLEKLFKTEVLTASKKLIGQIKDGVPVEIAGWAMDGTWEEYIGWDANGQLVRTKNVVSRMAVYDNHVAKMVNEEGLDRLEATKITYARLLNDYPQIFVK
jgi:hypothetical protein